MRACGTHGYVETFLSTFGGRLKERDSLEELCLDGKLLLKWILKKQHSLVTRDKSESRQSPVASCCEHGNELLRFKIYMSNFLTSRGHVRFSRRTLLHDVRLKV